MTVSISELKAHLSRYLRRVKRGGEVRIVERGVPIARITPIPSADRDDSKRERLVRLGLLRPGSGSWKPDDHPPAEVAGGILSALVDDREDRF